MYGSSVVSIPGAWQYIMVGVEGQLRRWERRMRQGRVLEDATKATECLMQCYEFEDLPDGNSRTTSSYRGILHHGQPERPTSPDSEPEADITSPAYTPNSPEYSPDSPAYSPNSLAYDIDEPDDKYDNDDNDDDDGRHPAEAVGVGSQPGKKPKLLVDSDPSDSYDADDANDTKHPAFELMKKDKKTEAQPPIIGAMGAPAPCGHTASPGYALGTHARDRPVSPLHEKGTGHRVRPQEAMDSDDKPEHFDVVVLDDSEEEDEVDVAHRRKRQKQSIGSQARH
ncbi:hypothetical protein CYMTET_9160 [Cymbomonas tetramitiformis]|uniref:Uncharacterized protein n=1 Tax=Cymbomonas tetramitiformis TaxID=36881 RepID=A0AAE0GSB8_9CHLO|nr:hypothetical protein CYMTET_9160 [Cymbomonas tetramitiformis]